MAGPPPLVTFMEARADATARASARLVPGGEAGLVACYTLSDALDASLTQLIEPLGTGIAAIAVGGYGRREQCRHSDVDLMLLVASGREAAASTVLYPLWDAGLKVGHAVRTPGQALAAAAEHIETATALLDARFVAGDRSLFERLDEGIRRFARQRQRWLRQELAAARAERVRREPWQWQEPDVKNGRGGLRDLHSARWLALAAGTPMEGDALAAELETLLATRNPLHWLEERPNDRYRQDLSPGVAAMLGADRIEWGRRLFAALRTVDAIAASALGNEPEARRWFGGLRRSAPPGAPFEAVAGMASQSGERDDLAALRGALRAGVAAEPTTLPLDPLPAAPWLERLLPEWETLRYLPHIAPFHRHPVDVHAWRTAREMHLAILGRTEAGGAHGAGGDGRDTAEAAAAHGDPDELLLAALLHDIGKGHEGDHSRVGAVIAERFATRAGLDPGGTRRLVTAVQHHLLLPTVATRRDIADQQVIWEVADAAGDVQTLHLLYLLAVADARASGPDVWSPWKAQLLRALYLRTLDTLTALPGADSTTNRRWQAALEALRGRWPVETIDLHLRWLPPGYLLSTDPASIGQHLALIRQAASGPARTALHRDVTGGVERLTVVTPDRPGILAAVAGALAVHNVSVLGGVAYTRDDGIAIQVFFVGDALGHGLDDRRWERVLAAVPEALAGHFPLDERLAETRRAYGVQPADGSAARPAAAPTVSVDNLSSRQYSIVEVSTADRIGLLYAITSALHELALDIHVAKVDTIGREVVDAFYVRRENGRRIEEPDEIERVQRRISEAVAALDR